MRKLISVYFIALSFLFSCSSDDDHNSMYSGYDIEHDGLFYQLVNTSYDVKVVSGEYHYSGTINVPSSFMHDGKTYRVVSIAAGTFGGSQGLKEVIISNGIREMEDMVFAGSSNLTRVKLPDDLISIGHDAFNSCLSLKDINIPKSLSTIPQGCFFGCTGLTSLVIPDNITYIGEQAFCQCENLKSVTLSSELEDMGSMAFYGCNSLISIVIPDKISFLRDAFCGCENLQSIHLPLNLKRLGAGAFGYCLNLQEITLPEKIEEIESGAFEKCKGLTNITSLASNVPKAYGDSFLGSNINNGTLYVKSNLINDYKTTSPWKDFANIKPINQ